MVDIIIAFAAAISVPACILLNQSQQFSSGLGARLIAALSAMEPGGLPVGLACMLAAQALAALVAWKGVALYYIHWVFRNEYDSSKKASRAVMEANALPLSEFMKRKLRRGIARQFCLVQQEKHNERMRQQGLL